MEFILESRSLKKQFECKLFYYKETLYLLSNNKDWDGVQLQNLIDPFKYAWSLEQCRDLSYASIIREMKKDLNYFLKVSWSSTPKFLNFYEIKPFKKGGNIMDFSDIIKFKMISGMFKEGENISIEKLAMFNVMQNGSFSIGEVLKAKLMGELVKDNSDIENLPLDKLIIVQMIEDGNFDIGKLLQFKLMSKLMKDEL